MNATTSPDIASIAARGLENPKSLKAAEIRAVCASALRQVEEPEYAFRLTRDHVFTGDEPQDFGPPPPPVGREP
jgi:hypothetical protein